jgi:hypothetical protein
LLRSVVPAVLQVPYMFIPMRRNRSSREVFWTLRIAAMAAASGRFI